MSENGRTVRIGRRVATLAAGAFTSYRECMIVRSEYARYYRIDRSCYSMSGIPLLGYPDWYFLYSSR